MESFKRQRTDLSPNKTAILEEAFLNGMNTTSKECLPHIEKISTSLGMTVEKVKVWINNRRARERMNKKIYKKAKSGIRGPTGYSLFAASQKRGTTKGTDFLKENARKWKELEQNEKNQYNIKAQDIRNNPLQYMSKTCIIKTQLKIIENAVMKLEEVGYAIGGFGIDPEQVKNNFTFSTSAAENFFTTDLFERFEKFFNTTETSTSSEAIKSKERKAELRRKLRKHFHSCWVMSTHQQSAIPYSKLRSNEIKAIVRGLPTDIDFKEPSSYGEETMKRLLKLPISFVLEHGDKVLPHEGNLISPREENSTSAHKDGIISTHEDGIISTHEDGIISIHEDGIISAHEDALISANEDGLISAHEDGLISAHEDGLILANEDGSVLAHGDGSVLAHGDHSLQQYEDNILPVLEVSTIGHEHMINDSREQELPTLEKEIEEKTDIGRMVEEIRTRNKKRKLQKMVQKN